MQVRGVHKILYLRAWQECVYTYIYTLWHTLFYIHNVYVCACVQLKYYLKNMLLVATGQQEAIES